MARQNLNIRPSIYIGLGGTGILAISQTKKMYEDEFGEGKIPNQIAFLAIDFDTTAPNNPNLPTDISNDYMIIPPGIDPLGFYQTGIEQGEYKWMFPNNTGYIAHRILDGASQVRTAGRLYTELVYGHIEARVRSCFNRVQNIANLITGGIVDVHMVMSIAGGTGAGSFLTVAHIIKEAYPTTVNLYGYGVNYGVFRAMDVKGTMTPRVVSNAYAAIKDIDYTMHATPTEPKKLILNNQNKNLNSPLFDTFYVVDNKTSTGGVVNSVRELSEVVGTSMYLAGNQLGNNISSIASNVGWQNGSYDIKNKRGWAHGMGACQVVYKGEELAKVFKYKIGKVLIQKLTTAGYDIEQAAISWTQRNEVLIREDGDQFNMLIDSIYSSSDIAKLKAPSLDIKDSDTRTKEEANKYIDDLSGFTSEEQIDERQKSIIQLLEKEIDNYLKQEGGVANAIIFLDKLRALCIQYRGEMQEEYLAFDRNIDELTERLKGTGYREYESARNSFTWKFKGQESKETILDECIGAPAHKILKFKYEALRRRKADSIFNNIITEIDKLKTIVDNTHTNLRNITTAYNNELEILQRNTTTAKQFEYDLSQKERVNMTLTKEDEQNLLVSTFIASLARSIAELSEEELSNAILAYTDNLERTKVYRETMILDLIDNLSTEEWEDLIMTITSKSDLLLDVNNKGQKINGLPANQKMVSNYMVAFYDDGQDNLTRFQKDKAFMPNVLNKHWVPMNTEFMKQRVIFYRVDGAIIPYCLNEFPDHLLDREYDAVVKNRNTFNPHYDKIIYEWMLQNDFKLKPEMSNEAMFYWVCGQLFGWDKELMETERIMLKNDRGEVVKQEGKAEVHHDKYVCCIKGSYYYWNEEEMARPGTRKWVPLEAAGTTRRDTAFNYFKTQVLPSKKECFRQLIKDVVSTKGNEYLNGIINTIISDGIDDYINKLVCSDKSSITYSQKGNGGELQLIMQEFQYISRDLKNALSNI